MRPVRAARIFELGAPLAMAATILVAAVSQNRAPAPTVADAPSHIARPEPAAPSGPSVDLLHLVSITLPPLPADTGGDAVEPVSEISRPKPNTPELTKPAAPKQGEATRSSTKVTPPRAPAIKAPTISTPGLVPVARVVRPTRRDARDGAVLLEAMARGEAPGIRIDWPAYRADRDTLRAYLTRCAGWRVLLSTGEALWSLEEEPGTNWTPPQATSGYMRQVTGTEETVASELIGRIRQRHDLTGGQTVAVVARAFDARLIGGLANLFGAETVTKNQVSGRYVIDGSSVRVSGFRIGDWAVPGVIDLGRIRQCG
jgi:hypothetical protein